MQKYAANAWRKHLEELEEVVKEYENLVRKVDDELEGLNSKRRLSQEEAEGHLRELNEEWRAMTRKCFFDRGEGEADGEGRGNWNAII